MIDMTPVTLKHALQDIAEAYNLDADTLVAFADTDALTGWDGGSGDFPIGSLFREEGQVLYALIRAVQPSAVVELGTAAGASTSHIAAALEANGKGKVTAVDHGVDVGSKIPVELRSRVQIVTEDALDYLAARKRVDFVFEDLDHTADTTARVAAWAAERLTPGGFLVLHDAMHWIVGEQVRAGIARAGLAGARYYLIAPGDCGLAVWRKEA